MRFTFLMICLSATALVAQDKQLSCEHQGWGGDRAHFCEMREQTIPSAGRLDIDGRQNGGVTVKSWDRSDVLVRSQVNAQGDSDADARNSVAQVIVHAS